MKITKKGYIFVVLFSLFVAIGGTIKYRMYKNDLNETPWDILVIHIIVGFLFYLIPCLFLVRWYYKIKVK
jgi:RsiW-degrading membrane proteinase PrsW (M82 family)